MDGHFSKTKSMEGGKIKKGWRVLTDICVESNRKKSMVVNDKTIALDEIDVLFQNSGGFSVEPGRKATIRVFKKSCERIGEWSKN